MRARASGLSLAETLISLGLFLIIILAALGALNSTLKIYFTTSSRVGAQRNLLQASSLLKSEAQCAAFIYGETSPDGLEMVFTNNFFTRENPPVIVHYLWSRKAKTLTRSKVLVTGTQGPYLVGSGISDMTYADVLPDQAGARVHVRMGECNPALETDLYLLRRCVVSQPLQGGYYSVRFWASFWRGWTQGLNR